MGPLPSPGLPPGHSVSSGARGDAPPVVLYFRLYAGFVTLVNMGLAALGLGLALAPVLAGKASPKPSDFLATAIMGFFYMAIGVVFGGAHLVATVMPRKRWAHTYGLVILAIALVLGNGGCCLFALPLLIFWSKEDVKLWFSRGEDEPSPYEGA